MKMILGAVGGAVLVIGGALALSGFAGGCGRRHHGRDPAEMEAFVTSRVDDLLDDIDATPEQRARIHEVKDRLLAAAAKARGGHEEVRDAVRAEWTAERPDAAKLHALVDTRAEELRAFAHQAVDAGIEVHDVLTPEQRAKIARKIDRWHR